MADISVTWPAPHAWDSTRLRDLMLCTARFYYRHMLALESGPIEDEFSLHLEFGRVYHAALAMYELEKFKNKGKKNWPELALRAALEVAWRDMRHWPEWADTTKLCEVRGLSGEKNQLTMIRAICWYHDSIGAEDSCETLAINGKPALEIGGQLKLPGLPHGAVLCFNMDRVVKYGGGNWVIERKTTKSQIGTGYWHRFDPDIQIDLYAALSRLLWPALDIQGVIVDAVQTGVNFSRYGRNIYYRHKDRGAEAIASVVRRIQDFGRERAEAANTSGPPLSARINTAACQAGGGACNFRSICATPAFDRETAIKARFHARSAPWNPLADREIG